MTFPVEFPDVSVRTFRFGLNVNQSIFTADFSRKVSVQTHAAGKADRWEGVLTTAYLNVAGHRKLTAWLVSLQGQAGTFRLSDPDRTAPQTFEAAAYTADDATATADMASATADNGVFPSGGIVDGAGQGGTVLATKNWPANALVLKAGDLIEAGGQLLMLTADANTDGAGKVSLAFQPALRQSPADGAPLIYLQPRLTARLVAANPAWETGPMKSGPITFAFEEAL
ncbi:MAG TPA: hypothetical protein VD713_00880 [Sphingomonadales bacterium]|nr:hypothetical protein [Sphingomonadales bacterium]